MPHKLTYVVHIYQLARGPIYIAVAWEYSSNVLISSAERSTEDSAIAHLADVAKHLPRPAALAYFAGQYDHRSRPCLAPELPGLAS